MVQRIQINVAQQRTEHRSLRRPGLGFPFLQAVQNAGLQKGLDQPEHPPVRDAFPQPGHQPVVRDRVEVALQVGIHHVHVTLLQQVIHPPQCVFAAPSGPKAVAVLGEFLLEDRFDDVADRGLAPPDRAPWESPAVVARCSPAWGYTSAESPAVRKFRPAVLRCSFATLASRSSANASTVT